MGNVIEIHVEKDSTTLVKGKLLEELGKELLKIMNYEVMDEVRVTGMEVDLLAVHKNTGEKIYIECKAHKNNLPADVITKLLGNVQLNEVSAGWLFTTGPLGKDAKGIVDKWAEKPTDIRKKLQIYTSDKLVERLIDANKVVNPISLSKSQEYNYSEINTLLITEYGRFWALQLINVSAGVPQQVILFDAENGKQIQDRELIGQVSKLDTSLSGLEFVIKEPEKSDEITKEIEEESNSIVIVSSGDKWADYRPSRPQDFVGREELQKDIFNFLNSVNSEQTATRLLAIKSPSGWGKSSILIKLSAKAKRSYNKKYFIHAVDVRAANSPRYCEFAFLDCFKKAIKSGFIKKPTNDITLSSIVNPFNDPGILEITRNLKKEKKVIVLFFDQFEEILSKPDLEKLFDNIRSLSLAIDAEQENLVLGFAWKTDGTTPTEHSAYHMWQSLSDRRNEFELSMFAPPEISKALKLFSKELGMPLNNTLRRYLIDHCQGYPWLLKKLCIHVHSLIKSGISQVDVLGKGLDIKSLFEKDLNELSGSEIECLKAIAKESPADFHKIDQNFGDSVVTSLIRSRLVIRKGHNLILYWDIFRDYVLTNAVPNIAITYIPQSNLSKYYELLQMLINKNEMLVSEVAANLDITIKAAENIIRDMVMVGNVKRQDDTLILLQPTEIEALQKVYNFLTQHILYKNLLDTYGEEFSITTDKFSESFKSLYEKSKFSQVTTDAYIKKIIGWFIGLNMMKFEFQLLKHNLDFKISDLSVAKDRIVINGRKIPFLGSAPAHRILELIEVINSGSDSHSDLQKTKYRNAITVLSSLGMVVKQKDTLKIYQQSENYEYLLARKVMGTETIQIVAKYYKESGNEINFVEIGHRISEHLGKPWKTETKLRYGNALSNWFKWSEEVLEKNHMVIKI